MGDSRSGAVDVTIDEVSYHGHWRLAGGLLTVSYGDWQESADVKDTSPSIEELAKRLLTEVIDRDLTYRGRPDRGQ